MLLAKRIETIKQSAERVMIQIRTALQNQTKLLTTATIRAGLAHITHTGGIAD